MNQYEATVEQLAKDALSFDYEQEREEDGYGTCTSCSEMIRLEYKFCTMCGKPNQSFDPIKGAAVAETDLYNGSCEFLHKDSVSKTIGLDPFCSFCGQKFE